MNRFSQKTKSCLENAGWISGRSEKSLCQNYEKLLEDRNFIVNPVVKRFLEEFGGLRVFYLQNNGNQNSFHFNVYRAVVEHGHDPDWICLDYGRQVGKPLCVIGEVDSDNLVLSLSESGEVYAGCDDILMQVGNSVENALEVLCNDKEFKELD